MCARNPLRLGPVLIQWRRVAVPVEGEYRKGWQGPPREQHASNCTRSILCLPSASCLYTRWRRDLVCPSQQQISCMRDWQEKFVRSEAPQRSVEQDGARVCGDGERREREREDWESMIELM